MCTQKKIIFCQAGSRQQAAKQEAKKYCKKHALLVCYVYDEVANRQQAHTAVRQQKQHLLAGVVAACGGNSTQVQVAR